MLFDLAEYNYGFGCGIYCLGEDRNLYRTIQKDYRGQNGQTILGLSQVEYAYLDGLDVQLLERMLESLRGM